MEEWLLMSDITNILALVIGAVLGALSRYHLTEWIRTKSGTKFPYGTFVINITGCFAMGIFWGISNRIPPYPQEIDLLIRTGFLGSYTTFSTYGFDTLALWRTKQGFATGFYWAGSAILGLGALRLGVIIAQTFFSQ